MRTSAEHAKKRVDAGRHTAQQSAIQSDRREHGLGHRLLGHDDDWLLRLGHDDAWLLRLKECLVIHVRVRESQSPGNEPKSSGTHERVRVRRSTTSSEEEPQKRNDKQKKGVHGVRVRVRLFVCLYVCLSVQERTAAHLLPSHP